MTNVLSTEADERNAPYAAPANVMSLIRRFRERDFPAEPFTPVLVEAMGIPAGMVHRTLRALEFLGLLDEDGEPTNVWRQLSRTADDVFPTALEGIVRTAYREVFSVIDPAKDSQTSISNVFRKYTPLKQKDKMVTLFLSLCREAGIPTLDTPRRRRTKAENETQPSTSLPRTRTPLKVVQPTRRSQHGTFDPALTAHPLIVGLLRELPVEGASWSKAARTRWLAAAGSVVDLLYEITEEDSATD